MRCVWCTVRCAVHVVDGSVVPSVCAISVWYSAATVPTYLSLLCDLFPSLQVNGHHGRYRTVWYCIVLYCTVLYCTVLPCTACRPFSRIRSSPVANAITRTARLYAAGPLPLPLPLPLTLALFSLPLLPFAPLATDPQRAHRTRKEARRGAARRGTDRRRQHAPGKRWLELRALFRQI